MGFWAQRSFRRFALYFKWNPFTGHIIGVNPGVWGSQPPDFWLGSWEIARSVVGVARRVVGGRGGVSENTISYFAQKVCWKVICLQEKETTN